MKLIFIFIGIMVLGCQRPQQSLTQLSDSENGQSIDASLPRRVAALTTVSDLKATYVSIRDHEYLGENGIAARFEKFNLQVQKWNRGWQDIWQLVDSGPGEYSTILDSLSTKLSLQEDALHKIEFEANEISKKAAHYAELLKTAKRVEYSVGSQDQFNESIERAVNRLATSIESIGEKAQEKAGKYRAAFPLIVDVAELRLKNRALERDIGAIEEALGAVEQLFAAEKMTEPLRREVITLYQNFGFLRRRMRIFAAAQFATDARERCQEISRLLDRVDLSPAYIDRVKANMESTCDQIQAGMARLESYPIHDVVVSGVNKRSRKMRIICLETSTPRSGCEQFRWLSSFSESAIRAMSEAELKVLEQAWDRVDPFTASN